MNQLKIKLPIAIAILLVSAFAAFSQAVIKTADGFVFIVNKPDKSLTFEIKGNEVKTLKSSVPMFMVDGKVLQVLVVSNSNFVPKDKKMNDEELLDAHKIWESDYLSTDVYAKKLSVESEKVAFGERKALFWGFTRPSDSENFDRDYFLSTNMGSYLLALGSPATPQQTKAETKKFLSDLMNTMKVSDKPFDITKMADEIRKSPDKKKN